MKYSIAMIGCGGVSSMHFAGCAQEPDTVQIVGCCDPDPARTAWAQEKYGIPIAEASLEELIAKADFQAAIVCTPTSVREDVVKTLAAAGKHMLVEKPLSSTFAEAETLLALCQGAGVALAVNQNFRWHYPFHLAKAQIAAGLVGRVQSIFHQDLFFRQDAGWRTEEIRHALMVMGVHWLDGIRWILDTMPVSVSAQMASSPAVECRGETEATVQLNFENGPVASYVQSFSSPLTRTETLVIGDEGLLKLDYGGLSVYDRAGDAQPRMHWPNPYAGAEKPRSAYANLAALLNAVAEGREPDNSGGDNLKTIALLEAAYQSAAQGQTVTLNEGRPE